jgi:hypothetical protein
MGFVHKVALTLIALFLGMAMITAARSRRECPSLMAVAVAVTLEVAFIATFEMVK